MNLHGSFRPCSTKYTESLPVPVESGTLSRPVTNREVMVTTTQTRREGTLVNPVENFLSQSNIFSFVHFKL